jgi:hypothetical protein
LGSVATIILRSHARGDMLETVRQLLADLAVADLDSDGEEGEDDPLIQWAGEHHNSGPYALGTTYPLLTVAMSRQDLHMRRTV